MGDGAALATLEYRRVPVGAMIAGRVDSIVEQPRRAPIFSRRIAPELCWNEGPRKDRGRRESRVPIAPAASRAKVKKAHEHSHYRFAGLTRPSLRDGFNGLSSCSPRRPGFLATVACRRMPANLTPASGRQDHTISQSASSAARLAKPKRPSHPASTFVTTRTPLW